MSNKKLYLLGLHHYTTHDLEILIDMFNVLYRYARELEDIPQDVQDIYKYAAKLIEEDK